MLPRLLFDRSTRSYNTFDLLNTTVHSWKMLAELQARPLLYSSLVLLEWCTWFPMGQERAAADRLCELGLTNMGNFFENGVLRSWEQVRTEGDKHDVLTQFHYYRARHLLW